MPTIADFVATPDGTCPITLATPDGDGPWPGVVMYPDAGGARATMNSMAAELASYGYAVLVPDVYYRNGQWEPFDIATVFGDQDERTRLFSMIGSVTQEAMATDAGAFFDYLAAHPDVRGTTFGTTGYCMGGRTSIVIAGRVPERVAAALSFHGGGLVTDADDSPHLGAEQIQARVYVAGAENDRSFTAQNAETLDKALTAAGVEHTVETYPAGHGFAVPDNPTYDQAAAARHWGATNEVLGRALS